MTKKSTATIFMSLFLLMFLLLSGCQVIEPENLTKSNNQEIVNKLTNEISETKRGNSNGNIANSGYVASNDTWIYYYDAEKNSLYKAKKNGTNKVKIVDDAGFNINLTADWIIYTSERNKNIYRVKLDSAQKEKLNNEKSSYVNVVGDWIYYVNETDGNRIYKMRLNGKERTKINNVKSARLNVIGEWIYYCKVESENTEEFGDDFYSPFGEIYKIKIDGTEDTQISTAKASFINVVDNWIFYSDVNDGLSLYKIKMDGTGLVKIVNGNSYYVNVSNENIYFSDMSSGLFEVDLNGKNKVTIGNEGRYSNINVVDDWLYFELLTGEEDGFYKIRNDGTGKIKVVSTESNQFNNFKVTKEQALKFIADNFVGYEGLKIEYLKDKQIYGISWENPNGGSGGYWEIDPITGDVFSPFGELIGNMFEKSIEKSN